MLNLIKNSLALAAAITALFIAATFSSGTASASANSSPFNPALSGTIAFSACAQTNTCGPSDVYATISESGMAAGLGQVTNVGKLRVVGPRGCGVAATISDTMTAANGDLLFVHVDLTMCPTSSPGIYTGDGTFTIDSGTGRFVGATGSG